MRIFMCKMVVVAQLVRAPDCGSGGRRFETDLPPQKKKLLYKEKLFWFTIIFRNLFKSFINFYTFFSVGQFPSRIKHKTRSVF